MVENMGLWLAIWIVGASAVGFGLLLKDAGTNHWPPRDQ